MMFKVPPLIALSCILCGCASYQTCDDHRRELQAQLQTVVVEDGINLQEANIIAQSYFLRFGPGCGVATTVSDDGAYWVAKAYIGIAAVPTREPIRINKRTGQVTWSDGPTIENPKTIF